MPRVKLRPRDHYAFETQLTVRVSDVNYGRHLGNDSLLSLVHQARLEILDSIGMTEVDLGNGFGQIMTDISVNFHAEGRLLDQLTIDTVFEDVTGRSFRMAHRVRRGDTVVALIEAGFLAFDYKGDARAKLPSDFEAKVKA